MSGLPGNDVDQYLRRPAFPAATVEFQNLKAYLQISKKQKIEVIACVGDLGIHQESWIELAQSVEGKELQDIYESFELELSEVEEMSLKETFFPLPSYLLWKLLTDYLGTPPAICELKNRPSEDLICRCFGVYKEDIQSFLKEHPGAKLVDVSGELLAGSGCSNCVEDIEELIQVEQIKKGHALIRGKLRYRPAGMTPAEFVLELDQFLKQLLPDREVEILGFQDGILEVKISGTSDNIKERVEGMIFEYYGTLLKIKLSVLS